MNLPYLKEGDVRVCCSAVLDSFGNFNVEMQCFGIFSILDGILKNYPPSSPMFSKPFPVSDWTFPTKLNKLSL